MPLEPGCHVQRGWIEVPRTTGNREHGMAQTLHIVTAEAASGKDEPRHETQILRLELGVPVASPWCQRNLVCAGRGSKVPAVNSVICAAGEFCDGSPASHVHRVWLPGLWAAEENLPAKGARLGDKEVTKLRGLASRIPTTGEENGIVKVSRQKSDTGQRPGRRISTGQGRRPSVALSCRRPERSARTGESRP